MTGAKDLMEAREMERERASSLAMEDYEIDSAPVVSKGKVFGVKLFYFGIDIKSEIKG